MKIVLLFDCLEDEVSDPIRFLALAIDLVDQRYRTSVLGEVTRAGVVEQRIASECVHNRYVAVELAKVGFEFLVHLCARVAASEHEHGEDCDCKNDEFFHNVISLLIIFII